MKETNKRGLSLENRRFEKTRMLIEDSVGKDSLILNAGSSNLKLFDKGIQDNVINLDIRRLRTNNFVQGDVQMLPFKDDVFDVCIFTEMVPFLPKLDDDIDEVRRTCKKVVVSCTNNNFLRKILWLITGKS